MTKSSHKNRAPLNFKPFYMASIYYPNLKETEAVVDRLNDLSFAALFKSLDVQDLLDNERSIEVLKINNDSAPEDVTNAFLREFISLYLDKNNPHPEDVPSWVSEYADDIYQEYVTEYFEWQNHKSDLVSDYHASVL